MLGVYFRNLPAHRRFLGNSICVVQDDYSTRFPNRFNFASTVVDIYNSDQFIWRIGDKFLNTYTKLIIEKI